MNMRRKVNKEIFFNHPVYKHFGKVDFMPCQPLLV